MNNKNSKALFPFTSEEVTVFAMLLTCYNKSYISRSLKIVMILLNLL